MPTNTFRRSHISAIHQKSQPSFKFSDDVAGINKDETEWAKKNGLIIEKLCKEFMSDTGKTSFRNDLKGFEINRGFFYGYFCSKLSPIFLRHFQETPKSMFRGIVFRWVISK